jgi:plastin-1
LNVHVQLINFAVPGTIDERAINKKANLNIFQKTENVNLALGAAANIGCRLVNVGAQDIIGGRTRLILGLVWQIIKIQLMSKISFKNVPNLTYLLESGEDKAALTKLSGESILLRWVNYHLKRTRVKRTLSNFSRDLSVSL